MNYDSQQPENPGLASNLLMGDWTSTAGEIGHGVAIAGMFNPALGPGMFFPAAHFAGTMFKPLGKLTNHPAISPLVGGHMVMDGMAGGRMLSAKATEYWGTYGDAAFKKFSPGGTRTDKYFGWLADKETIAANRRIMGMIARDASKAGGMMSRAGLKAGLEAAGWEASLGSKIAASARVGGVISSRLLPLVGWGMFAYDVMQAGKGLYNSVNKMAQNRFEEMRSESAVPIVDNMNTLTERRRALASIQQSRMNARSAFGWEAKRLHY